jgi:methyl-accepting chemotaxis protein
MSGIHFKSISTRIGLIASITVLIGIGTIIFSFARMEKELLVKDTQKYVDAMVLNFGNTVSYALSSGNYDLVTSSLEQLTEDNNFKYIAVLDETGEEFFAKNMFYIDNDTSNLDTTITLAVVNSGNHDALSSCIIEQVQTKDVEENVNGGVVVVYSLDEMDKEFSRQLTYIAMIGLSATLVVILIIIFVVRAVVKRIKNVVGAAKNISKGDFRFDLDSKGSDEVAVLVDSMIDMKVNIEHIIEDIKQTAKSVFNGNLDSRGDIEKFEGEYRVIMENFNEALDAVIMPLNNTAEYIDRIAKGDMPSMITEVYRGDFNEIKTNINTCIDTINSLIFDMTEMASNHLEGDLTRIDEMKYSGAYREMTSKTNDMVFESHIKVILEGIDVMTKYGEGDFSVRMSEQPGQKRALTDALESVRENMTAFNSELMQLAAAASVGQLSARGDAGKFKGGWADLIDGVNGVLEAILNPFMMAAEYVDRIAKGDMPEIITDDYHGDFNEIKMNLNTCIESIGSMVSDVDMLISAAQNEEYDTRADEYKHYGDYRRIVSGINEILNSVVEKIFWFEQLMDAIQFPVSVTDMDMNWTFVNKAATAVMGKERKDVLGMQCSNWGADICGTDNCGIQCLRRDQPTTWFTQPGIDKDFKVDTNYLTNKNGEQIGHIEIVQDISQESRSKQYDDVEIKRLSQNLKLIASGNMNIDSNIQEASEYTQANHANFSEIYGSFNELIESISSLITDSNALVDKAIQGDLGYRANETRHNGDFSKIISGLNQTMEAFVTPVNEAGSVLSEMATGDLTAIMNGEYSGQFATLKRDINLLSNSLNEMVSQVNETVSTTASSAMDISSTAETLAAASQEMNSQADDVAAAVEEMARTVTENAQGATKTSAMAMENAHIAEEGGQVVQETVQKMGDIAKVVEETAINIQKLGESSQAIGEIVSVIDDIADQTNLLALNASIEAARAGEQGRGFAVVADEVRKLAEKTVDATKEIASQITGIQKETASAVEAMNLGTKEVESGMQLAQSAGEALEKVLTSSNDVTQMITDIAAASEQQAATTEEISKNVIGISHATSESTHQVEAVAGTTEELTALTEQLSQLMAKFKVDVGVKKLLR